MNYEDSVKYIHSLLKFGMNLGLRRISALLNELGNPRGKARIRSCCRHKR